MFKLQVALVLKEKLGTFQLTSLSTGSAMPTTFGILDDHNLEHVPGTVNLANEACTSTVDQQALGLKHGTGRYSHIVLAPQPSDDPNDPLVRPSRSSKSISHQSFLAGHD